MPKLLLLPLLLLFLLLLLLSSCLLAAVSCLCVLPLLLLLLLLFLFGCLWSPLALGFHLQLNYARNFSRNLFSFALLSSSLARVSGPHGHLGAVGPTLPGGGRARLVGEGGVVCALSA